MVCCGNSLIWCLLIKQLSSSCTDIFEESAENKLEYTPLFQQYTKLVEDYIESKIKSAFPDLTMPRVESLLASKKGQCCRRVHYRMIIA